MRHFDEGAKWVRWFSANNPVHGRNPCDCLSISFVFHGKLSPRDANLSLERVISEENFNWMRRLERHWSVDFPEFRRYLAGITVETFPPNLFKPLDGFDWINRAILVEPEIEHRLRSALPLSRTQLSDFDFETVVALKVYQDDFMRNTPMKIFLSHKGADKPLVRDFYTTLKALGFDPWLDENAMPAGTKLERGIKQGFKDSCAAVFFITSKFKDQGYLATEVDYAIQEEREKENRFKIISICFEGKKGVRGEVPELLRSHVWKSPKTKLEALRMIIQALPIELGPPLWKIR